MWKHAKHLTQLDAAAVHLMPHVPAVCCVTTYIKLRCSQELVVAMMLQYGMAFQKEFESRPVISTTGRAGVTVKSMAPTLH